MGFLDNMAKKAFEKEDFQKSWRVHLQAFGPILEPAFANDYASRIHLGAALGRISRKDINGALEKLKPLQKALKNDADRAAWLFFVGLAFEQAGDVGNMLEFYQQANAYNHRFFLPYLKVAKYAYEDQSYGASARNYRQAISCFDGTGPDLQEKTILASAYTNLASCLTMMHQFEEAHAALATSRQYIPDAHGRFATEAILYAAQGNQAQATECLKQLEETMPDALPILREVIDPILSGDNSHFFLKSADPEKLETFWVWFQNEESGLLSRIEAGDGENALHEICQHLHPAFPFLEDAPAVGFRKTNTANILIFPDGYSRSLEQGYQQLLSQIPQSLGEKWEFSHEH